MRTKGAEGGNQREDQIERTQLKEGQFSCWRFHQLILLKNILAQLGDEKWGKADGQPFAEKQVIILSL